MGRFFVDQGYSAKKWKLSTYAIVGARACHVISTLRLVVVQEKYPV